MGFAPGTLGVSLLGIGSQMVPLSHQYLQGEVRVSGGALGPGPERRVRRIRRRAVGERSVVARLAYDEPMIPMQLPAIFTLLLSVLTAVATAQAGVDDLRGKPGSWRTVLDGVMGGLSTGRVEPAAGDVLAFAGELSLENNGGFSSMRRALDGRRLQGTRGLVIECCGDGREYNFDLRVSSVRRMAAGYRQAFATAAGEWTEVRLPFEGFRLQSFGRFVRNAPNLDPTLVESMGVTLSDKKPGNFRLEIRSIRPFGAATENVGATAAAARLASPVEARGAQTGEDAVRAARAAGLTTLLKCVEAAGIDVPRMPVTIFAPTNGAFAKLPQAAVQRLLEPANRGELRKLLGRHVVPGRVTAKQLLAGVRLESLGRSRISATIRNGRLSLNGSVAVVATDLQAGKVTIHQIDAVLLPATPRDAAVEQVGVAITKLDLNEAALGVYATAIDRGAPLFNAGNVPACTAVYEIAVDSMLLLGGRDLGDQVFRRLLVARREVAKVADVRERAWLLRGALDEVAATLQQPNRATPVRRR
ncbi:MAG: CIA30 family protein [bacterium]|nr:CIA30 family protein [bacterium]